MAKAKKGPASNDAIFQARLGRRDKAKLRALARAAKLSMTQLVAVMIETAHRAHRAARKREVEL